MVREVVRSLMIATLLVCAPGAVRASCVGDEGIEILRIRVVNEYEGEIAVSSDCGWRWEPVGRVLRYTESVNERAYTAAKWVQPGCVAATAVNAIHVNVGLNETDDRGIVFSLLPREFLTPPKDYRSFLSPNSSICTDIPAGSAIFGGGAAPFVGNPVHLEIESTLVPIMAGYVPRRGDVLVVKVIQPLPYPISVEFENRPGGTVRLQQSDGSETVLGWVIRPVLGIGRFGGSIFTAVGRIRAGHAGVVDVSTSPDGLLGGFQIIPVGHALSPEMDSAWRKTQWMIVGPAEKQTELWEGLRPLFCQHVRPAYRADDVTAPDWWQRLLDRFLVDVKSGGIRKPVPCLHLGSNPAEPLPGWANFALAGIDRIRLLFPLPAREPETQDEARRGRS
jgi:hypothetical protein